GAGGLLAPLGPRYTALEIIGKLRCKVIVVAANRLGTINHTLLTVRALQTPNPNRLTVVLSDHSPNSRSTLKTPRSPDTSRLSNLRVLRELLAPLLVHRLPCLGPRSLEMETIKRAATKL